MPPGMKRFTSALLALASAGVTAVTLTAARPQYGGTLRAAIAGAIRLPSAGDLVDHERVLPLVFESLTRVDAEAGLQPLLAESWTRDARAIRWAFRLRSGVTLHDGSALEPYQVAASLRAIEGRWRVTADGASVIVELPDPAIDLPWRLADTAHAISVRASDRWLGTGPFRLDRLDTASLTLRAYDGYRDGRPFLDTVEIQLNRPLGAQLADVEAGRLDLASLLPTDSRRVAQRGLSVVASRPIELVALVFEPHRRAEAQAPLRRALAAAVNRSTMSDVLLQHAASPASSLLPPWLSGPALDGAGPRATASPPSEARDLLLRVEPADALLQAIAERVAVDARERGFTVKVQVPSGLLPRADARLVRARAVATTPERALVDLLQKIGARLGAAAPLLDDPAIGTFDDVRRAETVTADSAIVVPIVHVPDVYAVGARVSSWRGTPIAGTGVWNLADVWVKP
jgi:hypothetical protein